MLSPLLHMQENLSYKEAEKAEQCGETNQSCKYKPIKHSAILPFLRCFLICVRNHEHPCGWVQLAQLFNDAEYLRDISEVEPIDDD